MPRPLSHADHRAFVETEGWQRRGTARGAGRSGDYVRYVLRLADGDVLMTRVSHGSGAINDPTVVALILREQLRVSEDDFHRCVRHGVLPPRPQSSTPQVPHDALDAKLVRNLIRRVGLTQTEVAALTSDAAIARWQAYLAGGTDQGEVRPGEGSA